MINYINLDKLKYTHSHWGCNRALLHFGIVADAFAALKKLLLKMLKKRQLKILSAVRFAFECSLKMGQQRSEVRRYDPFSLEVHAQLLLE